MLNTPARFEQTLAVLLLRLDNGPSRRESYELGARDKEQP